MKFSEPRYEKWNPTAIKEEAARFLIPFEGELVEIIKRIRSRSFSPNKENIKPKKTVSEPQPIRSRRRSLSRLSLGPSDSTILFEENQKEEQLPTPILSRRGVEGTSTLQLPSSPKKSPPQKTASNSPGKKSPVKTVER